MWHRKLSNGELLWTRQLSGTAHRPLWMLSSQTSASLLAFEQVRWAARTLVIGSGRADARQGEGAGLRPELRGVGD